MAVNVFDVAGTWRRGLSDPGALSGTLSVDTDTGRVSALSLLRTGGVRENTGSTISTPSGPKLVGGTPLPNTTYGFDAITFQGVKGGQYRIETALCGGYTMVAAWQLPTGSLASYAGGAVTFSFTSGTSFATSNAGSGTLKLNGAPFDISLSPASIPENSPVGTRIGLLSTSDPTAGDAFTYTFAGDAGAADNASFQIVGNELRSKAVFDFETKNGYTVRIRTTDRTGLWYEKTLPIQVTDVAEDDSVPRDFLPGVADQLRRDAWQAYRGDRRIDRTEMIALLRKTGESDGVVTGPEVAGLQRIAAGRVGTAWEITMDDPVRNLARKVVEDNPANRMFQGSRLGSLNPAGGSTTAQMNQLVGKWFQGADRPAANANGSYGYQSAAGSLFVNGPSYTDARQGYLGDCYFIAALGSIAKSNPVAIQNMFIDNGDSTFTVRFFYPSGTSYVPDYVTVDRMLPVSGTSFVYSNVGDNYSSVSNELWMPLAEKAYAQWNETGRAGRNGTNTYSAIEGGWMSNVDGQVLGRAPADYSFSIGSNKQVLIDAINANKGVTIATRQSIHGLYSHHAYMGIGYDPAADTFRAYNPWGNSHPGPLTWSQLQSACSLFTIADTSNVPPITTPSQPIIAPVPVAPAPVGVSVPGAATAGVAPTSRPEGRVGHGSRSSPAPVAGRVADAIEPSTRKFHGYGGMFADWQDGRSAPRSAGVSGLQGPRVTVSQAPRMVAVAGIGPVLRG